MRISSGRLYLSLPSYIHPLFYGLKDLPENTFFVGGIPRDIILGEHPKDADIAFCGPIHSVQRLIENTYSIKNFQTTRFFTINYVTETGFVINLAHFRRERYPEPATLPHVSPAFSIEEDIHRRDFTINSLYLDPKTLQIIDPKNGLWDLKNRVLRVNYKGSFRDDPTRIFRGIRYKARMGLNYDALTLKEIEKSLKFVELLSKQRIINELKKIAEEYTRTEIIKEMARFSILDISLTNRHYTAFSNLDGILPHNKDIWIFFFIPLMKDRLVTWPLTRKEKKILSIALEKREDSALYQRILKEFQEKEILALSIIKDNLKLRYVARLKKIVNTQGIDHSRIRSIINCITNCSYEPQCMEHCLQVL